VHVFQMLAAVRFDDQTLLNAGEIHNVIVNRELSLKLVASEPLRTEQLPEPVLGFCRLRPHLLCTVAKDSCSAPLPAASRRSLPRGGGRDEVVPSLGRGASHWRSPAA